MRNRPWVDLGRRMRPGILEYCSQRLADSLLATTKIPESRKSIPGLLEIIGICPLAVMRNCPETASPITECDYPWSHGRA